MAFPRVTQILFFLCIIINSNRVHSTASTELSGEDEEQFLNATTRIIKQTRRVRRNLAFQPGSRIMFRVNTKDNIIKVNQIFAHGFGFRANIDVTQPNLPSFLPSEQELHHNRKRRSLTRHEVYETLEELINQHGFDGRSCIMKMICDATEIGKSDGMLLKIFKLIFTQKESHQQSLSRTSSDYPMMNADDCRHLKHHCPLHLFDISPYTDV